MTLYTSFRSKGSVFVLESSGKDYADLVSNALLKEYDDEGNLLNAYRYAQIPEALECEIEGIIDRALEADTEDQEEARRDYETNRRIKEAKEEKLFAGHKS